ncbi:MAG TPA: ECF transporter S component [Candidatus Scatomonas pullistercoris]|uniref:ECF transporter S component n=1 Tax=Candidatus Scatomonas pullistercoris TaxID=2840920 RepID=A0A9D1P493_9FIRM|nr:ECF transporter S component [Candidatus Scatomonas pullistercoris]
MLCFRWVSVPDLRYTPYSHTGWLWKLEEVAEGIAWNYGTPEAVTAAADQTAFLLRIGMAVSVVLGILFIILAFRLKVRAAGFGRFYFLWNVFLTAAAFAWITDTNMALNILEGRENMFLTLTLSSHVQLTAAAYLQVLLAILLVPFLRKLLDSRKEYAAEFYQTRTETADRGIGKRTILAFVLILTAIPAVILFGIFFLNDRSDYFISICVIILSMLPFFLVFENRRPQAREIVVIAVMAGLAVAGRAAFFMLPQFKPTAAIVIITGISLGGEAGFLTGALAGFVSNFFYGQGPWTPWQMFSFGIIGFLAGLLFRRKRGKWKHFRVWVCLYGGLATLIIYGFLMDTSTVFMGMGAVQETAFLAAYLSGLPMNIIHGTASVIFLAVLGEPIMRKLDRIKKKYGILEP